MKELDLTDLVGFEFHYVVRYSTENKKFYVDVDTTDAMFHNGQVFTGSDWYCPGDDDPRVENLIREIEDNLAELLQVAQRDPNCTHAYSYKNPDFESLTCLECGLDVEPSED